VDRRLWSLKPCWFSLWESERSRGQAWLEGENRQTAHQHLLSIGMTTSNIRRQSTVRKDLVGEGLCSVPDELISENQLSVTAGSMARFPCETETNSRTSFALLCPPGFPSRITITRNAYHPKSHSCDVSGRSRRSADEFAMINASSGATNWDLTDSFNARI
jgi:hypothetical protein